MAMVEQDWWTEVLWVIWGIFGALADSPLPDMVSWLT
jgi:hypothetical protein